MHGWAGFGFTRTQTSGGGIRVRIDYDLGDIQKHPPPPSPHGMTFLSPVPITSITERPLIHPSVPSQCRQRDPRGNSLKRSQTLRNSSLYKTIRVIPMLVSLMFVLCWALLENERKMKRKGNVKSLTPWALRDPPTQHWIVFWWLVVMSSFKQLQVYVTSGSVSKTGG